MSQRLPSKLFNPAQLTAVVATYYTVPVNTFVTISAMTLTNSTATAQTATVHLVPTGGTASASNMILSARVIAAGEAYNVIPAIAHTLNSGDTIQALAGAAASITIHGSGYATNP
jgi:hypothetical protein